ncbi:hypothetical protein E2542_SST24000 [Spatholobus suberectus]|nr:hypothetical protein E2542_SST24000 [Spatholobus suberectus]
MEQKAENSMIISISQKAIIPHEADNKTTPSSLKKGKGSKNFFKVALFMMRGGSRKSKVLAADDESKSTWRKLLGSMRPLHLQSNESPLHNNNNNNNIPQSKMMITSAPSENGDDGFESASEFTYSPSPASSRYASAVGLNEMVQEEENENENEKEEEVVKENNDGYGDEMIDAKAEEFIAQFYHQMRLQRLDVMDRRYQEISMRSLGL